jgi:hypothetical protein
MLLITLAAVNYYVLFQSCSLLSIISCFAFATKLSFLFNASVNAQHDHDEAHGDKQNNRSLILLDLLPNSHSLFFLTMLASVNAQHDHDEAHGDKQPLSELARLDTCVTVVDALEFLNNMDSVKSSGRQHKDESCSQVGSASALVTFSFLLSFALLLLVVRVPFVRDLCTVRSQISRSNCHLTTVKIK